MPRTAHLKVHSRSESSVAGPRHSSDCASSPTASIRSIAGEPARRFSSIDAALIAGLLAIAALMMWRTGFQAGEELRPLPDAVEYAAVAVHLDRGIGPVLHFAGCTYPPRYTMGYPLMLAAAYPILGRRVENLCLVTAACGLAAVFGLYLFTLWTFDRMSAFFAAFLLATCPAYFAISTYVMSDVPSLAIAILAALAVLYAAERESTAASALGGLLAGFAIIVRPTNGAIVIAMMVALYLVRPRKVGVAQIGAFAVCLIFFPAIQLWEDRRYFGSIVSSGYVFWVPEFYDSIFKSFQARFLFAPAFPEYIHGNFWSYLLALLGLDGFFGELDLGLGSLTLSHARYALYPFAGAVFAAIGMYFAARPGRSAASKRAILLGLGFFGVTFVLYAFYFYLDIRFLLPSSFIVFAAAGYGLALANRRLENNLFGVAVLGLDLLLAIGIAVSAVAAQPTVKENWKLVPDVISLRPRLAHATVISDISLQWLELYASEPSTEFVALTSLYGGQAVTEYHVHWLFDKKSDGWRWPIPPILFPEGELDIKEAAKLADQARRGRPLFLLVSMPSSDKWANALKGQFTAIDKYFTHETVVDTASVGLYRLIPR